MAFNGSGTFVINSTGQPVVTGTTISSTVFNALTADLATGLSTCITKDGQSVPTANIPMGTHILTGLGNGSASTDSIAFGQVSPQTGTFTPIDSSGAGLTFTNQVGYYRKYAGLVSVWGSLTYPSTADVSNTRIGGLPFTAANLTTNTAGFLGTFVCNSSSGLPGGGAPIFVVVIANHTYFDLRRGAGTGITNANVSTASIDFQMTYPI